ncbi:MAG: T9SS type A sorting domain-containing protein [Bacteroidia bacterium]|nr:T9SS type A sorting domain-containing protein [Bacteroidia bacterium]
MKILLAVWICFCTSLFVIAQDQVSPDPVFTWIPKSDTVFDCDSVWVKITVTKVSRYYLQHKDVSDITANIRMGTGDPDRVDDIKWDPDYNLIINAHVHLDNSPLKVNIHLEFTKSPNKDVFDNSGPYLEFKKPQIEFVWPGLTYYAKDIDFPIEAIGIKPGWCERLTEAWIIKCGNSVNIKVEDFIQVNESLKLNKPVRIQLTNNPLKKTTCLVELNLRFGNIIYTEERVLTYIPPVIGFIWPAPLIYDEQKISLKISATNVNEYLYANFTKAVLLLDGKETIQDPNPVWMAGDSTLQLQFDKVPLKKATTNAQVCLIFVDQDTVCSTVEELIYRRPVFTYSWNPDPLEFHCWTISLEIDVTSVSKDWNDRLFRNAGLTVGTETFLFNPPVWFPESNILKFRADNISLKDTTTYAKVFLNFLDQDTFWSPPVEIRYVPPVLNFYPKTILFPDPKNTFEIEVPGVESCWDVSLMKASLRVNRGIWDSKADITRIEDKVWLIFEIKLEDPISSVDLYFELNPATSYDKSFTIYYRKPMLSLEEYTVTSGSSGFKGEPIGIKENGETISGQFKVSVTTWAAIDAAHINYDDVNAIQWRINHGTWQEQDVTPHCLKQVDMVVFKPEVDLSFGENHVEIRTKGINEKYQDEFSDIQSFDLFVYGIDTSDVRENLTVRDRNPYKIIGRPAGGWYEGSGIAGKTPYFYPAVAGVNLLGHEIAFTCLFKGKPYSNNVKIPVGDSPKVEFEISGSSHQACPQSIATYKIISKENEDIEDIEDIEWLVVGGNIETKTDDTKTITVKWNPSEDWRMVSSKNRIGYVIATRESDIEGSDQKTFMVDILDIDAPKKPNLFFGDTEHRLLICNSDSVKFYKWYKIAANTNLPDDTLSVSLPEYFASSVKPYVYLTSIPEENCLFFVELVNWSNCPVKAFIINNNNSPVKFGQDFPLNEGMLNSFKIYPNPASDLVYLNLEKPANRVIAEIVNILGEVILRNEFIEPGELNFKLDLTGLASGIYYVRVRADGSNLKPVKLVFTK